MPPAAPQRLLPELLDSRRRGLGLGLGLIHAVVAFGRAEASGAVAPRVDLFREASAGGLRLRHRGVGGRRVAAPATGSPDSPTSPTPRVCCVRGRDGRRALHEALEAVRSGRWGTRPAPAVAEPGDRTARERTRGVSDAGRMPGVAPGRPCRGAVRTGAGGGARGHAASIRFGPFPLGPWFGASPGPVGSGRCGRGPGPRGGPLLGGPPEECDDGTEGRTEPCSEDPPIAILGSISGELAVRDGVRSLAQPPASSTHRRPARTPRPAWHHAGAMPPLPAWVRPAVRRRAARVRSISGAAALPSPATAIQTFSSSRARVNPGAARPNSLAVTRESATS